MSDADTHSVAEIIWLPAHKMWEGFCIDCGISDMTIAQEGENRCHLNPDPQATPDDMLAWIHPGRAFIDAIEPESGLTPGASVDDRWCVHVLYENDQDEHFTAPTLHAALEAAVRAVAWATS